MSSRVDGAGAVPRWLCSSLLVGAVVGLTVTACGSDEDTASSPSAATDPAATSVTVTTDEPATPDPTATPATSAAAVTTGDTPGSPGAGTVVIMIDDVTVEFSGLRCFFGADAAALADDDDVSFGAVAEGDGSGVAISIAETVGVDMLEVFYEPSVGSGEVWYTSALQVDPSDSYTFEDGRVTSNSDFELVVDGQETRTETGSIEATCP